jgi:hypothetical protein
MIGGQAEKAVEAVGTSVEDRLEQLEAELQTCREELRSVIRACLVVLVLHFTSVKLKRQSF